MRLLVHVVAQPGRAADLAVDVEPSETVGALASHIAASAELATATWTLRCRRRDAVLDPSQSIDQSQIRTGDALELVDARTSGALTVGGVYAPFNLVVAAGPMAGAQLALVPGTYSLGRGPENRFVVDDPSMSRRHTELSVGASVTVSDCGSTNGTKVNGVASAPGTPASLRIGDTLTMGDTVARLEGPAEDQPNFQMEFGDVRFNRPPRIFTPYEGVQVKLPKAPDPPPKTRLPMIAAAIPLVMAAVMFALSRGQPGGFQVMSVVFMLMSPLMILGSYIESKRGGRLDHKEAVAAFETELRRCVDLLETERSRERDARLAESPGPDGCRLRVARLSTSLWERSWSDADFLDLRVGLATLPSRSGTEVPEGGDPVSRERVTRVPGFFAEIDGLPLTASLRQVGGVGIAGRADDVDAVVRALVLQTASLHSPADVVIAGVFGDADRQRWDWLKWLPHTRAATSPIDGAHLASGSASCLDLIDRVRALVAGRLEASRGGERGYAGPSVLFVVHESAEVELTDLAAVLETGPAVGVYFVWAASAAHLVPAASGVLVHLGEDPALPTTVVGFRNAGTSVGGVLVDRVAVDVAEVWARELAPLTDATRRRSRDAGVPRAVPLPDVIGGKEVLTDPSATVERWRAVEGGGPLPSAIGRTGSGVFSIDLRADGPHGLVGGTTGSGKSEFLQTMVVSLAAALPPTRINFLLVDYKGGAAFKECVDLPHTVGFITDLDDHLVHRARVSLQAELKYREHYVTGVHGAKDLLTLEQQRPDVAPPALLIVIDEFAQLKEDVPEFVESVVSVARVGRSNGVHLILATQSPGQAVGSDVKDNSQIRVALRVRDGEASTAVIDSAVAASLPDDVPGRAVARLGNRDLVEFQTAYAGGRSLAAQDAIPLTIVEFGFSGAGRASRAAGGDKPTGRTDLELLVSTLTEAARLQSYPAPRRPWLDPLPPTIDAATMPPPRRPSEVVLGVVDEPELQRQRPVSLDLDADGNLLVVGMSGAGKTTLLLTAVLSSTAVFGPDELNVYAIDLGGHGLDVLDSLPHTGGVIDGEETDRVARLVKYLRALQQRRGEQFAAARVQNLEQFHAAHPDEHHPRVVVLIDNLAELVSQYENLEGGALLETLLTLVRDGRAAGIHFVASAPRLPISRVASTFAQRVVLRMPSAEEYNMLGMPTEGIDTEPPPGRGLLGATELQVAAPCDASGEPSMAAVEAKVAAISSVPVAARAHRIGSLPDEVVFAALPAPGGPWRAYVGVGDEELAPVEIDLADDSFIVGGPPRSGRSTLLGTIVRSLASAPGGPELFLVTARKSPLTDLGVFTAHLGRGDAAVDGLSELTERILYGDLADRSVAVVVDDMTDLVDSEVDRLLEDLARSTRDQAVRFVLGVESGPARRAYGGIIPEVKKLRSGALLQPDLDVDGELLGFRLPRRLSIPLLPGRGFVGQAGRLQLFQAGH